MGLRFGVVANYAGGGPRLAEAAEELSSTLSVALETPVELVVASEYSDLFDQLVAGKIHIAWMPPLLHARATGEGAELVAVSERDGSFTYRSAVLVRADSNAQRLRDLRGARLAWVDPSSAAGYIFPRLDLLGAGINPERDLAGEKFYGSIALAADAVVAGDADACACHVRGGAGSSRSAAFLDVRQSLGPRADRLRVLHVTDSIPPDGLVVSGKLPEAERRKVREAVLSLNLAPRGRAAVQALLNADSLAPVTEHLLKLIQRWAHEAEARAALGRGP